jgi:hypothetical protein
MVEDPELKFDDRSAIDLKDRFRTHFNDSYRKLYPNARTHLSSTASKPTAKVENSPHLFDLSRSRKRRPFTAEEDAALKEGYENHGPLWATIVCHPVFKLQNRRGTDLRDRFRNAFPDLYCKAGYVVPKPKPPKRRKKSNGDLAAPAKPPRERRATTSVLSDTHNAVSDGELDDSDEVQIMESTLPIAFTQEPQNSEVVEDSQEEPKQASSEQPQSQDTLAQSQSQPQPQAASNQPHLQPHPKTLQTQAVPSPESTLCGQRCQQQELATPTVTQPARTANSVPSTTQNRYPPVITRRCLANTVNVVNAGQGRLYERCDLAGNVMERESIGLTSKVLAQLADEYLDVSRDDIDVVDVRRFAMSATRMSLMTTSLCPMRECQSSTWS